MSKLNDGLSRIGLNLSDSQIDSINIYVSEIIEFNKTYNIMKADSVDELIVNHILDSLSPYNEIKKLALDLSTHNSNKILIGDIGSGGGCPGIPLAIAFPEYNFILVERMEKRCNFLTEVINKLQLSNVSVNCTTADSIAPETFDIEVFRAFHPFDKNIARLLLGMLKKEGYIAAYKARAEKILAEMEEVKQIIPEYKKINLTVPFLEDHERNLVVIKK